MYQYLVPISYLMKDVFLIIGLILIHFSLLWISVAQYQMSNSWRIGIDENNKTGLITKGLFSYSRNPIFLGMIISVAGIFFILPNTLTFFLMLTTYIVIQIQIRLEEEFLEKTFGEERGRYFTRVGFILFFPPSFVSSRERVRGAGVWTSRNAGKGR